jgi:hypothetical protein
MFYKGDLLEVRGNMSWIVNFGEIGCRQKSKCLVLNYVGNVWSGYYEVWNLTQEEKHLIHYTDILNVLQSSGD